MPIILARIDDRLIHGQVVVGWAKVLKANHIVVADDEVIKNDIQKFLFRMATPEDIKLSILTIKETSNMIKERKFDNDYTIILFKVPESVLKLLNFGGMIGEVNIGGMHFSENKVQLTDAIFVDEKDIETFNEIRKRGVKLEIRMVPTDTKKDLFKVIDEKFKRNKK